MSRRFERVVDRLSNEYLGEDNRSYDRVMDLISSGPDSETVCLGYNLLPVGRNDLYGTKARFVNSMRDMHFRGQMFCYRGNGLCPVPPHIKVNDRGDLVWARDNKPYDDFTAACEYGRIRSRYEAEQRAAALREAARESFAAELEDEDIPRPVKRPRGSGMYTGSGKYRRRSLKRRRLRGGKRMKSYIIYNYLKAKKIPEAVAQSIAMDVGDPSQDSYLESQLSKRMRGDRYDEVKDGM
jgi:hypothetical protein